MTGIITSEFLTVKLVKYVGTDEDIVAAARVSTGAESRGKDSDVGLLNYLMRDRHGSPFEHNSMTFFIKAPIFVFREFQRHRVGWSYNEESGRYKQLDPEFYVPDEDRPLVQEGRPGSYTFTKGSEDQYDAVYGALTYVAFEAYDQYERMLEEGVAKEVARMCLPLNTYSSMYATCNARSLMSFLSLRTHEPTAAYPSHPMAEIEAVARQMQSIFAGLFPVTWEAFQKNGFVAP